MTFFSISAMTENAADDTNYKYTIKFLYKEFIIILKGGGRGQKPIQLISVSIQKPVPLYILGILRLCLQLAIILKLIVKAF